MKVSSIAYESASDANMIAAIQKGDQKAFEKLYNKYAAGLLGIIMKVIPERAEAEEILLSMFLKLRENGLADLPHGFPVIIRMFAMAKRLADEHLLISKAKAGREIRITLNSVDQNMGGNNLAENHENPVNFAFVTEHNNKALDLIFIKGCNYPAAASSLGISINELMKRVRAELKQYSKVTSHEQR